VRQAWLSPRLAGAPLAGRRGPYQAPQSRKLVRAAQPLPQPRPAHDDPTEVIPHLHGVTAAGTAATVADTGTGQAEDPAPGTPCGVPKLCRWS
jgi:hypothetical protein